MMWSKWTVALGAVIGGIIGILSPWEYTDIKFWVITMPVIFICCVAWAFFSPWKPR